MKKNPSGKDKAHKQKEMARSWEKGYKQGLEIAMLAAYTTLSDHFKFSQEKIEQYNYQFQKNVLLVMSGTISREEIEQTLLLQGIDLSVVGDSNIERIQKLKDVVM